jgi:hypothetical protein
LTCVFRRVTFHQYAKENFEKIEIEAGQAQTSVDGNTSGYRLYTRNMSDLEAKMEDQEADLEAQLEGQRNR